MTKSTDIVSLPPPTATSPTGQQAPAVTDDSPGQTAASARLPVREGTAVQLMRVLTCLGVCYWALKMVPFAGGAAMVAVTLLLALALLVLVLLVVPGSRYSGSVDLILLIGAMLACGLWVRTATSNNPGYGTDEVTLGQASAEALLSGHNPYTSDLSWAAQAYRLPPQWVTHTLDGSNISTATYPALSFLVYVPALLLGVHAQTAIYVDTILWLAGMLAFWLALPPAFRPAATLLLTFMAGSTFITDLVGGVTDVIYVPLLVAALWRWDRFGDPAEQSAARWMGPIALGFACAVKQGPWLLAPFLLIGVGLEAQRKSRNVIHTVLGYAAIAGAAFLLPNLPFVAQSPAAWLHGTLLPLIEPLVPLGQGLIGFSIYMGIGGGNLTLYSVAGALLAGGLMLALVWQYPSLKRLLPIFPAFVLFFATRSFPNYFLFPVFGLLVGAVTTRPAWFECRSDRAAMFARAVPVGAMLCLVGASIMVTLALLTPAPLRLRITGAGFGGDPTNLDRLTVAVTNRGKVAVTPQFTVSEGGYITTFWIVEQGPTELGPGESAMYTLGAPNVGSMPPSNSGVAVYAYTTRPAAISMSEPTWSAGTQIDLTRQSVVDPLYESGEVMLKATLRDRLGLPSHETGIPVYLDRVVDSSPGILGLTDKAIGDAPLGQGPEVAYTNDRGEAFFRVKANAAMPTEAYYQVWTTDRSHRVYSRRMGIRVEP